MKPLLFGKAARVARPYGADASDRDDRPFDTLDFIEMTERNQTRKRKRRSNDDEPIMSFAGWDD